MNVRDWSGEKSNKPLRSVIILMGSISAVIIVVAVLFAFMPTFITAVRAVNRRNIAEVSSTLKTKLQWKQKHLEAEKEEEDNQDTAAIQRSLSGIAAQPRPSVLLRVSDTILHHHKRHS